MILTTTDKIEGKKIISYIGIVSSEAVLGINFSYEMYQSMLMIAVWGTAVKVE